VKLRRGFVIKHPSCPFPEPSKGVHQFGGGSDTTSLYFEGEGGETLGRRGHSKDWRPHLKQMIVGVIIDQAGRPVCSEM
jgi:hypothetical protein